MRWKVYNKDKDKNLSPKAHNIITFCENVFFFGAEKNNNIT